MPPSYLSAGCVRRRRRHGAVHHSRQVVNRRGLLKAARRGGRSGGVDGGSGGRRRRGAVWRGVHRGRGEIGRGPGRGLSLSGKSLCRCWQREEMSGAPTKGRGKAGGLSTGSRVSAVSVGHVLLPYVANSSLRVRVRAVQAEDAQREHSYFLGKFSKARYAPMISSLLPLYSSQRNGCRPFKRTPGERHGVRNTATNHSALVGLGNASSNL